MPNHIPAYGGGYADTPSGSNAPINDAIKTAEIADAEAPTSTHWHVQRHAEDDTKAFETIFAALDYASTTLAERADFEHEGITIAGESGDTQLAYERFKDSERFGNLANNAAVVTNNHRLPVDSPERAPLYRGDTGAKLLVAAGHQVDRINSEGPVGFLIWECPLDKCGAPVFDVTAWLDESGWTGQSRDQAREGVSAGWHWACRADNGEEVLPYEEAYQGKSSYSNGFKAGKEAYESGVYLGGISG